ncbi:C2H2 finger domain protein, putative [Aspergillus oryzae 100-8]|uniref:C2H2 finger domain protein, putative n=1 Tax=Aspergillus oryzae (strain 3.042) TaxID=1160506 RepID=I8A3Z3_ASPO3|nr:C2H2 finger domain protein, putative [Aspergillus oryzae 3.042]KDE83849.1 C2H2 finger domain protein, putative [Aspergillus oryzae 100-8]|eukprot:EIT79214.1 C2H2 finger domain protein, putative [Aspergillus oryzae 3.042]
MARGSAPGTETISTPHSPIHLSTVLNSPPNSSRTMPSTASTSRTQNNKASSRKTTNTMRRTNTQTEIPLPITYTPTTHRISKAKKGKRVHACEYPGCNKVRRLLQLNDSVPLTPHSDLHQSRT